MSYTYIYGILALSAPLLLASFGALVSEYAGCMALFLDGIINLSAFLCFTFTSATGSPVTGTILTLLSSVIFISAAAYITDRLHANAFLSAIALNLLSSALVSMFSAIKFKTTGILTSSVFVFSAGTTRLTTTAGAYILTAAGGFLLYLTKPGLYLRITGSDTDVLEARGIKTRQLRIAAWATAALYGAAAGCIFSLRLSSFVPNISSGTGWTALAAVFLGRKNIAAVTAAVFIFAAAQFAASNLQNISLFRSVPSSLLFSLPYLTALILILFSPRHR